MAKNRNTTAGRMLLAVIDNAIAAAPAAADCKLLAPRSCDRSKYSRTRIVAGWVVTPEDCERLGYRVFKYWDGKYTVLNVRERLVEFRRKLDLATRRQPTARAKPYKFAPPKMTAESAAAWIAANAERDDERAAA